MKLCSYITKYSHNFYINGVTVHLVTTQVVTFGLFFICMNTVTTTDSQKDESCSKCYSLNTKYLKKAGILSTKTTQNVTNYFLTKAPKLKLFQPTKDLTV